MNILGTYSGIGMDTIDQLIAAEKGKGVQFTNKKTKIEAQQSAWKDIGTRLDSLYSKIEALQNPDNFFSQTVKSNVTNSAFMSVSSNKNAVSGTHRIEVERLATASRLTGGKITYGEDNSQLTSIDQKLGFSGLLVIRPEETVGPIEGEGQSSTPLTPFMPTINIEESDSLKDIAAKINEQTKASDVQASIVDNRLILTSTKMGQSNITLEGNIAKDLGLVVGSADGEAGFKEGQKAKLIIDGLTVERSSNSIDDAIEGLTINLTNEHKTGESELITVAHNTQKTVDTIKEFVDQYNSVIDFIGKQTEVGDPSLEDNKTGALVGESSLVRLQSGLRTHLMRNLKSSPDDEGYNLSELGIKVDRYGKVTLDESALREKVLEDPTNVARAFYQPNAASIEGTEGSAGADKAKGGMSDLLKNFVDSYTSSSRGIIKTKQESYDRMIKNITEQIDTFNERIERKRDRYIREFSALDQAMMQAESQMDYLFSQLNMERN